ncbi:PcaG [Caligus rogercresseyi]|uniref:PcaG n=1 Tax=Caligus rogercresseyi TaxID=217165 RepID=A0A7T8HM91_CALRO|nr:PcaG [Caligus rogercresseyi]
MFLLEAWQANAQGIYAHPESAVEVEDGFSGFGRVITNFETGEWALIRSNRGSSQGVSGSVQAPHINLWIVARGINVGLNTRIYFEDETDANAADPVINVIEWENRRATLLANGQYARGK